MVVTDGAHILLHGSAGSRWLRLLALGAPFALSVTAMDALVIARSALEFSMNYRSAVLFGSCAPVVDQVAALDLVTEGLFPGRVIELRAHSAKELAVIFVFWMTVGSWTLKVSDGWPEDSPEDVAGPAWAGVLPLRTGHTERSRPPTSPAV